MTLLPKLPESINGPNLLIFTTSTADSDLSDYLSDDYNFEVWMRKLSLKEQLKIRNSRHSRIKELVSRLFAKLVLNYIIYLQGIGEAFDPWRELHYEYNEYGKPSLREQKELKFEYNSSSSNDIIGIMVQINSNSAVGIDLSHESQDSISPTDFIDQFSEIFGPMEFQQLTSIQNIHQRYVSFNHFWTLKEAFTKFVGCGLHVDLSSITFQLPEKRMKMREPIPSECRQTVIDYDIEWLSDITVEYEKLPVKFRDRIEGRVYCCSGVLRKGPGLPVIISCISEEAGLIEKSKNYHINMSSFLKEME